MNDQEQDHLFKANLLRKIHKKPINPTTSHEEAIEYEKILNNQTLSLLPGNPLYKADIGKPAWGHVYKIGCWGSNRLPAVPTMDLKA